MSVGVTGFEPATFCTPCRRASQVTLHPVVEWTRNWSRGFILQPGISHNGGKLAMRVLPSACRRARSGQRLRTQGLFAFHQLSDPPWGITSLPSTSLRQTARLDRKRHCRILRETEGSRSLTALGIERFSECLVHLTREAVDPPFISSRQPILPKRSSEAQLEEVKLSKPSWLRQNISPVSSLNNVGLWTWLSLFFFNLSAVVARGA